MLTTPGIIFGAPDEPMAPWVAVVVIVSGIGACASLFWRRRHPILVVVVAVAPEVLLAAPLWLSGVSVAPFFALGSLAIRRSARAAWIWFTVVATTIVLSHLAWGLLGGINWAHFSSAAIGMVLFLLIGTLIGANIGSRQRYVAALIDLSRQLLVERDQQAQLAAAAERTRIAREMHDIVSHSLTVIVALSEGAAATTDTERARTAARSVASTARTAPDEMRVMLGVLRDGHAGETASLAPLLSDTLADLVAGARSAGFPVTLSVTGIPDDTPIVQLAVQRIVQEGLTNAMRYARQPAYIRANVRYGDGIEVTVENDGVDAPTPVRDVDGSAHARGAGYGLQGLRERVGHLGGTLEAGPSAPGVWRLRARLPRAWEGKVHA